MHTHISIDTNNENKMDMNKSRKENVKMYYFKKLYS